MLTGRPAEEEEDEAVARGAGAHGRDGVEERRVVERRVARAPGQRGDGAARDNEEPAAAARVVVAFATSIKTMNTC